MLSSEHEQNKERAASLIGEAIRILMSVEALLITVIAALTAVRWPFLPSYQLLMAPIAFLISIVFGLLAHGALTSAVRYGKDPFEPRLLVCLWRTQYIFFLAGCFVLIWAIAVMLF